MDEKPTDSVTAYALIGGEQGIVRLVAAFYQVMERDPKARAVRAVHGASLVEAQAKLQDFLTGWLGGPPIYMLKYGHPRMRMRHMPFAIGTKEMEEWLYCMDEAMNMLQVEANLRTKLADAFRGLAEKIRNQT